MSSEIIEDIKRAKELAKAIGYMEGLRDVSEELGQYLIPAVRRELVVALTRRYMAAHPEIKEHTRG